MTLRRYAAALVTTFSLFLALPAAWAASPPPAGPAATEVR
jgi:hypothetical protein